MNILNIKTPGIINSFNFSVNDQANPQSITNLMVVLSAFLVSSLVLWKTLSVGFLLDDFYHVQYFHNAFSADWSGFLAKLHGDWSGDSDGMTSYRPLLSTTMLFIFFLGKQTALGFHIANIFLLALCGISVYYLSYIIINLVCGHCSKLTSVSAMLLFLTCPLHIESSATATNGGDLLSGLFYLTSLIAYFKYKNSENRWLIAVSLFSSFCALLTKEIAVTLPAIVSISALLYPKDKQSKQKRIEIFYWLELLIYGIIRTTALGTIIGGYRSIGSKMLVRQFQAFGDGNTIQKLFFPLNEHIQFPHFLTIGLSILYAVIALRAIFLLVKEKKNRRLSLFLLLWIIIGILPTFQIWHIYPNMIGSRLFFISSVPFCLLLSFFATSNTTAEESKSAKLFSRLIPLTPIFISAIWASIYITNLTPYEIASTRLETIKSDLKTLGTQTAQQTKIVLLALPKDYFGAPMLSHAEYLSTFCQSPCMNIDLSHKVFGIEQPGPGAHEFIYVRPLSKILSQPAQNHIILVWSNKDGRFLAWHKTEGASAFSADLESEANGVQNSATKEHLISFSGPINTLSASIATLKGNFKQAQKSIKFFWHAEMMPSMRDNRAQSLFMSVPVDYCDSKSALFGLQKYLDWTYATRIIDFGLDVPQDYPNDSLQNLSIVPNVKVQPQLDLIKNDQTMTSNQISFSNLAVAHFPVNNSITMSFNLQNVPDAHSAGIEIPTHSHCFLEAFLSNPGNARIIKTVTNRSGQITLSNSELRQYFPRLHNKVAQLRILALNSLNQPIGLPSEPVSFALDIP